MMKSSARSSPMVTGSLGGEPVAGRECHHKLLAAYGTQRQGRVPDWRPQYADVEFAGGERLLDGGSKHFGVDVQRRRPAVAP